MKILKVIVIDSKGENTIFEVIYKNIFGRTITRKAYRMGKHDLCSWLDTDNLISLHCSSLCTILDSGISPFSV